MLTAPLPLSEGVQTTSITRALSPTGTQAAEKGTGFAGKFNRALSDRAIAGDTGSAKNLKNADRESNLQETAPKQGGKSAASLRWKSGQKISDTVTVHDPKSGVRAVADAAPGAGKTTRAAAAEDDSPTLLKSMKEGAGKHTAEIAASGPAVLDTQKTNTAPVEPKSQKTLTPDDGAIALAVVSPKARDHAESVTGNVPGGDQRDGRKKHGSENGSLTKENGKTVIEVRDLRTTETGEPLKHIDNTEIVKRKTGEAEGEPQIRLVGTSSVREAGSAFTATQAVRSDGFSAYVREQLSSQIVKQSGIILRNNNQGEIRLVLKPEHLGRVRMRIQLDENRLSGKIFVDSSFVKESFEQNLEALYRAFRNSGFVVSGFEVMVGGQGSEDGKSNDLKLVAAKSLKQLDDAVPILEEIDQQSELIDLVV